MMYAVVLVVAGLVFHDVRAQETFPTSTLSVATKDGVREFSVEVATTPQQHAQGLMFRRKMPADSGMVFVYRQAQPISMWMKNTMIPLDMVFINGSGAITKIVERTIPMSQEIIASGGSVKSVLELNGGTASRLGLKAGDRVSLSGVFD
jgi:uncharacterized protein